MNEERLRKTEFSAISIKNPIAKKFRKFSKKIAITHSETLQVMMNFFERNSISPNEDVGENMVRLEKNLQKRINVVIAIMKDIEKTQTRPTIAMLQALLEQEEPKKKPLLVEKKRNTGNQPNYREFNR